MANRYWVGGIGSWTATSTANWSATSGGPSGASAPTSVDDVFLDANSGGNRVAFGTGPVCANLTCTGFTGSLEAFNQQLIVHGNVTLSTTMTTIMGDGGGFTLAGVGTHFILSNGRDVGSIVLNTTGTYGQSDALLGDDLQIVKGTYLTNNYNISCDIFCYSTETAVINFGSSTVFSGITFLTGASLTLIPGTSTVTGSSINTGTFARTFYNWSPSFLTLTGNATFNNVIVSTSTTATFGGNMTVTGTLTLPTGSSVNSRIIWASNIQGVQRTISANSLSGTPTYYFFSDINITGSIAPLSSSFFGDLGNNSGITFPTPVTYYWVGGGGVTWGASTSWATSSGGTPTAVVTPLPQDSAVFDDNSGPAGMSIALGTGIVYINSITATSRTLSLTFSVGVGSPSRQLFAQGDVQFSSACTLEAFSNISVNAIGISLIGRVLQNLNLSGVTSNIPFQFNNSGGGVKLLSNLTVNRGGSNFSPAIQHTRGIVDTNGYNITVTGGTALYLVTGTQPKTLILGTTILTTSRWQKGSNSGDLTINGTGTIKITGTAFFAGNSTYYPNIECAAPVLTISSGNAIIGNITNSYKTIGASTITFSAAGRCRFGSFNLAGEATRICNITSNAAPTRAVLIMANGSPIDAGSTSTSGGNNSGVTFTGTGTAGFLNVTNINSLAGNGFLSMM